MACLRTSSSRAETRDQKHDEVVKHDILVECNFVDPEQIAWPAYVKAEQVYNQYLRRMAPDADDPRIVSRGQGRAG